MKRSRGIQQRVFLAALVISYVITQFNRLETQNRWPCIKRCLVLGFGLPLRCANVRVVHL